MDNTSNLLITFHTGDRLILSNVEAGLPSQLIHDGPDTFSLAAKDGNGEWEWLTNIASVENLTAFDRTHLTGCSWWKRCKRCDTLRRQNGERNLREMLDS